MSSMLCKKQNILADGIDYAEVYLFGDIGEVVDYTINNTPYQVTLPDEGGEGSQEVLQISCDISGTAITVRSRGESVTIYAVGE